MFILTGGSSVYKGLWSACDLQMQNKKTLEILKEIFGTYLLSRGIVNGTFTFFVHNDVAIIQSRRYWHEDPQEHIFTMSLLKFLLDCKQPVTIHSPFNNNTNLSIRRRIDKYLSHYDAQREYTLI